MRRAINSACTATVIVTLAVAGCTTTTNEQSDSARTQQGAAAEGAAGPVRELTDAEVILIERAEQLLVRKCVEKEGFRYWLTPVTSVEERQSRGFVLSDVDWARTYGYGGQLEKKAEKIRRSDPNHAYANSLPEAERIRYSKTVSGDPSKGMLSVELPAGGTVQTPRDGCWADTRERLYGDRATWFRVKKIATSLTPLYVPDLVKDKRLVNAVKAWARCMRAEGHDYADPNELRDKRYVVTEGLSPARAHATEVELAVAEATCAVKTSLATTARSLEREYRTRKLGRYSDDIAQYQRMRLDALARAKDVIDSQV
ncbi:hypothetical protein [Streptomyces sp. NPDC050164]|uniref:hypothetical protein n=1 Tax=Streptomyces sp. NPDC050164 TaxID=3365605 RepID=UPI0037AD3F0B